MAGADGSATQSNNQNYITRDGRAQTYDRSLRANLKLRTPQNFGVVDTAETLNRKYKYFHDMGIRRPEAIAKNSIALSNDFNNVDFSVIDQDKRFGDIMYAQISEDKPGRIRDYRTISAFSEVADALDEICDECINTNENHSIVTIDFLNTELDSVKKEKIQIEFEKFVQAFDLDNKGWRYFRQFLIEGELFFECIIHEDYKNEGILAVENLPCESIDPVYDNIQNMLVKAFIYKKPIFDPNDPRKVEDFEFIPFDTNQIIYVNNEQYNETKEYIIPFLENCRRSYRQLSLIEDSVVIHRMVHAPLRFVFNVDVGRMPVPQAESYLRKLQSQYWSSKTFDVDQNDVVKKYSPQSMLDSYWFAKRQGQEPTTVSTIGGQPADGNLDVLDFFLKKLYRSLKVPTTRLSDDSLTNDGTEILKQELKFAKMIIRQQKKFAAGIKKGFITHLKFRHMFEENNLTEENLKIDFVPPTNFFELRESQKLQIKVDNYNNMIGTGNVSDTFAKKKYLSWNDRDILADRELRRKDAELQWELAQIEQFGPDWKRVVAQQDAGGGEMAGELGGIDGTSAIPEFGGGPAAIGDEGGLEEFGGEADTTPPVPEGGQEAEIQ